MCRDAPNFLSARRARLLCCQWVLESSAPVEVAFAIQPWHIEPCHRPKFLQLLVIEGHIWLSVISDGGQLAVVLQLVLELGKLLDNLLALVGLGLVGGLGDRSVDIVDGLGLERMVSAFKSLECIHNENTYDDDRPPVASRNERKRRRVAGHVGGCASRNS